MNAQALFRLAGMAAILGGGARILAAFVTLDAISAAWLYTAIDVLLLFGLIGIYLDRFERLRFLGLASFILAVAALSFIGGPDADPFGFSTYEQGATVLAIAMVGLAIAWVQASERPLGPALCWFASIVAVGALSFAPAPAGLGFMVAGALFGAGFLWAGVSLIRR